jgi:hypothetical protein
MRAILLTLCVTGALALPSSVMSMRSENEDVGDPNRVICRTEQQIGSRLQKIRRCHTAAEWAEIKRENRRVIDKVQAHKPSQG